MPLSGSLPVSAHRTSGSQPMRCRRYGPGDERAATDRPGSRGTKDVLLDSFVCLATKHRETNTVRRSPKRPRNVRPWRTPGERDRHEGRGAISMTDATNTNKSLTLTKTAPRLLESREPRAESREPRAESREPRAESREPRAESREPRAESREPRAESREPRAESREPRAESREPRAESREPRAESREPRAESREPRAESREPRAESREPRAESREPRAESHDYASCAAGRGLSTGFPSRFSG